MNQARSVLAVLNPSGRVRFAPLGETPERVVGIEMQRINMPKALFLNKCAKYTAIAGALLGATGIASVVGTLSLELDARGKLEYGAATAGLLLVGVLCCGISNCLYCCGLSGNSNETAWLENEISTMERLG